MEMLTTQYDLQCHLHHLACHTFKRMLAQIFSDALAIVDMMPKSCHRNAAGKAARVCQQL